MQATPNPIENALLEHRILIHAPIGKDARLIAHLLESAGIECVVCISMHQLVDELKNVAGGMLIADEAINPKMMASLSNFIRDQPDWSDLPLIVLTRRGVSPESQPSYLKLGNVSIVERPAQGITIITAAKSALRARQRQYVIRDLALRKDEFLAMLAHELRNPLAPIRTAADLLRIPSLAQSQVAQSSEVISRQIKHMTGLIDDLLDISRVSRGLITLDESRVDALQIVLNAVEQVRPIVDSRNQTLTIQTPHAAVFVNGDQKRLVQALTNVLNNAAKYTAEEGNISLVMEIDDTTVRFIITDNGIGIAPHVIPHVFDMFTQAERNSDRSQGGLGIGLALVKNLMALHRGSVSATSGGLGQGSQFILTLPRAEAASEDKAAETNTVLPTGDLNLLIVDDNIDAGEMLGMVLEVAGYHVIVESSAIAALLRAKSNPPDVFLLDIGLPDMDGKDLAKLLRQQHPRNPTFIAITGYGQDSDKEQTAAAGFDFHFVKPVDTQYLLGELTRISASHRRPTEHTAQEGDFPPTSELDSAARH